MPMKSLLSRIRPHLVRLYRAWMYGDPPNLLGDRDIENAFILANIPSFPGKALDFGCGNGLLALGAAMRGFNVTAIDRLPLTFLFSHPDVTFIKTDLFDFNPKNGAFDLIINCSSVEHVGLSGRYNFDKADNNGDLDAMSKLKSLLAPEGRLLMTVPVGSDRVWPPFHRVYGKNRLSKLLAGFKVLDEQFWVKDGQNRWVGANKEAAMTIESSPTFYAIGGFILSI